MSEPPDSESEEEIRLKSLIEDPMRVVYSLSHDLLQILPDAELETPANSLLPPSHVSSLNQLIRRSEVIFSHRRPIVLRISPSIAVKIDSNVPEHHVKALQHVHAHAPSIPAPRTHGLLRTENGHGYYHFKDYVPGDTLEDVWPDLSVEQLQSVRGQLDSIFCLLRSVPSPLAHAQVSGWGWKGTCTDGLLSLRSRMHERQMRVPESAIENEAAFNDFLTTNSGKRTAWFRMMRSFMREDHALVMTHSDLHPKNIIVQLIDSSGNVLPMDSDSIDTASIKIVSIVDWETCGWYPEYWEFSKGIHTIHHREYIRNWWEYLLECIGFWPVEATLYRLVTSWRG